MRMRMAVAVDGQRLQAVRKPELLAGLPGRHLQGLETRMLAMPGAAADGQQSQSLVAIVEGRKEF
jgi:hypothetical protein